MRQSKKADNICNISIYLRFGVCYSSCCGVGVVAGVGGGGGVVPPPGDPLTPPSLHPPSSATLPAVSPAAKDLELHTTLSDPESQFD